MGEIVMIGRALSHYRILEKLGAGGMGEVYRAHDSVLDRDVALKVLPEGFARDPERLERFEREARAVARLSHSNILQIHDYGTEDGIAFAVTELLEGSDLRDRLAGDRSLPWKTARDIATAVADGLAAAHSKGVVHRDIKPANLFVTEDNQVKILDFGLANLDERFAQESDPESPTMRMTEDGTVLGTVGYMSPEQARGEAADARSDIFALGCVLYEMLTGRQAFGRESAVETLAAVLRDEPPSVLESGFETPPGLLQVVERCLEKRPQRRFQSAGDLAFALRAIGSGSQVLSQPVPAPRPALSRRAVWGSAAALLVAMVLWWGLRGGDEPAPGTRVETPGSPQVQEPELRPDRLAVLPFENRTGEANLDGLGTLAADSVASGLAKIGGLDLVPTSQVIRAIESVADHPATDRLRPLASRLQAGLVVTGAYYRVGERLQIRVDLQDTSQNLILKSLEPVDADPAAPEGALEEVRSRLMCLARLGIYLSAVDLRHLSHTPLDDTCREFFVGFAALERGDDRAALEHLSNAAEAEPEFFLPGYLLVYFGRNIDRSIHDVWLAHLKHHRSWWTEVENLLLDVHLGTDEGRWEFGLTAARRLAEIAPKWDFAVHLHGHNAINSNRPREGVEAFMSLASEEFSRGLRLGRLASMAAGLHMLGRYEDELQLAKEEKGVFPEQPDWYYTAAVRALAALGRIDELRQTIQESRTATENDYPMVGPLLYDAAARLRLHGHSEEVAQELADEAAQWYTSRDWPGGQWEVGRALWAAGRLDQAHEFFQEYLEESDEANPDYVLGSLGCLAALRGDTDEARRIADELGAMKEPGLRGRNFLHQGLVLAHLGELDRGAELIAQAYAQGTHYWAGLLTDPHILLPIWNHPAYQEVIRPKG